MNLVEEDKWLLAVNSFEATISVFKTTHENNSFSISIPGRWTTNFLEDGIIDKPRNLLKLRSQRDIKLHVEQVRKRGNQIKIRDTEKKYQTLIPLKKKYLKN